MEKIEKELNDFGEQYDQAKEEYEYVKEVLEDPGFEFENLQHEISILEEISDKVEKS